MAERFPHARIVAVSNSHSQRELHRERALSAVANLEVVTADMNTFDPRRRFDRIVSVEMFEHMMNWRELLPACAAGCADGRLFLHIFSHRTGAYLFDRNDREDWIAQHFFTGGVMPSHHLIRQYADLFEVEKEWRWSGAHYRRTADDWLKNFDANRGEIEGICSRSMVTTQAVDAALALVLPRHLRAVRLRRRQRMGRQPLPDEGRQIVKTCRQFVGASPNNRSCLLPC